jgi:hypothetical protein
MRSCPYCGATANNTHEEVKHMEAEHPEIIEQRMLEAGFRQDLDGRWFDPLASDD